MTPKLQPIVRQEAVGSYNAQAVGERASATVNHFAIHVRDLPDLPGALLGALAPRVEELFDLIEDPSQVIPIVFRGVGVGKLSPSELPLLTERQKPVALDDLLRKHSAILVLSRAGMGKTREAAEAAKTFCEEGWLICVAKAEGDARLDELASFPDRLRQRRLLFLIDDLHQRPGASDKKSKPYLDRLDSFLRFFETRLQPPEMRVLITARSEPKFRQAVKLTHPTWRRFVRLELSEFKPAALEQGLIAIAQQAGMALDKSLAARLVHNSDKTPRTLIENVRLAAKRGGRLSAEKWLPTQQRSWVALFEEAGRKLPEAKSVFGAVFLLRLSSVAARLPYVIRLAGLLSGKDAFEAAAALVDYGLLGLSGGVLDAFAEEQFQESLTPAALPDLGQNLERLIGTVLEVSLGKPWRHQDLFDLAWHLFIGEQYAQAEAVASAALAEGGSRAVWSALRGMTRRRLENSEGALADLTDALEEDPESADLYYERALARNDLQSPESEADATSAIEKGFALPRVFALRASARISSGNVNGAEEDINKALAGEITDLPADFGDYLTGLRGIVRNMKGDFAAAEQDFTAVIGKGPQFRGLYSVLGWARLSLGKYEEAENDFTAALRQDANDAFPITIAELRPAIWGNTSRPSET